MNVQTIYTNPARSEYAHDHVDREPHNPKLMHFVHHELKDCMVAAYPSIAGLRYVEDMVEHLPDGRDRHYEQAVIIVFDNGYRKIANVHMDSPWGAIKDVMKAIER